MKKILLALVVVLFSGYAFAQSSKPINGFGQPTTGSTLLSNGDVVVAQRGASPYSPNNPTYSLRVGMGGSCPSGQYVVNISNQGIPSCSAIPLGGSSGDIQYNNGGTLGGLVIGPGLVNNSGILTATGTPVAEFPVGNPNNLLGYTATGRTPYLFTPNGDATVDVLTGVVSLQNNSTARGNLGLGDLAVQSSTNVSFTGGTILGVDVSGATVLADPSLTDYATLAARFNHSVNVKDDCGVLYDGSDQTANLAACRAYANSFTPPKALVFNTGVVVANETIGYVDSEADICVGARGTCTVRAPSTSGLPALTTYNWATLFGSTSTAGANNFYSYNMEYDGNARNGNTVADAFQIYGYNYRLDNIAIKDAPGHCFVTAYGGTDQGSYGLEAFVTNFKIDGCGMNGIDHWGPHDMKYITGVVIDPSASNTCHYSNIVKNHGGFDLTSVHTWRRDGAHKPLWAFNDISYGQEGDNIIGGFFEAGGCSDGTGGGVHVSSQSTLIDDGTRIQQYAGGNAVGVVGLLADNNFIHSNAFITCNGANDVGIQIGSSGHFSTGLYFTGSVNNCGLATVDATYDNAGSFVNVYSTNTFASGKSVLNPNARSVYHVMSTDGTHVQVPNVFYKSATNLTVGAAFATNSSTILAATGSGVSGGNISMYVGGQTRYKFDPRGYALFNSSGYATGYNNGNNYPTIQGNGTSGSQSSFGMTNWAGDSTPSSLFLGKSRGAGAVGTLGVVSNGDELGRISAQGYDGAKFMESSAIKMMVKGTATVGAIPAGIDILTATASGTLTSGLYMDSDQNVIMGLNSGAVIGFQNGAYFPKLQVLAPSHLSSGIALMEFSGTASTTGVNIIGAKSGGSTNGSNALPATNSYLANFAGYGADGASKYFEGGSLRFSIDGTATGGAVPGKAEVWTSTSGGTATKRLTVDSLGRLALGTATANSSVDFSAKSDALILQTGTTGNRPSPAVEGMVRLNTTLSAIEVYVNSAWRTINTTP